MQVIDGVSLPDPATWIIDPDRLDGVGRTLLAVCTAGLKLYGKADRYERSYVGHGTDATIEPSTANQLTVFLARVHVGQAGREMYEFFDGDIGKLGYQTAHYFVEVSTPWPTRQGTTPIPVTAIDEYRQVLWSDGLIVWNTLMALALGGVVAPAGLFTEKGVAVGPMSPKSPRAASASWIIEVQVQL